MSARGLCDDGRLQSRELANIVHAAAKMSAAEKLVTDDAGVQDMLAALEQRVVRVASDMAPQADSNTVMPLRCWVGSRGPRRGRRWWLRWCAWVRT